MGSWHTSNHDRELKFGIPNKSNIIVIYDVKDDPNLQDSIQEPSTSSKYDLEDGGFLTHF